MIARYVYDIISMEILAMKHAVEFVGMFSGFLNLEIPTLYVCWIGMTNLDC